MIREREYGAMSGWGALVILLAGAGFFVWQIIARARRSSISRHSPSCSPSLSSACSCAASSFLGSSSSTRTRARCCSSSAPTWARSRQPGLRWANPFYTKKRVSLRVRNFESAQLKVNDIDGNPIEIAAVVVWKVVDTAEAVFEVDDYENYVHVQSEAALRNLATSYPYDAHDDDADLAARATRRRSPST